MGPLNPADEAARREAPGRHQVSDHAGPRSANISTICSARASRRTSRRSSAPTTVRVHELGENDVDPTPAQLERMRALVRQAMKEGALGVGSSLIYAPATYAEDARAGRAHDRGRRNAAACTSPTCAAKANRLLEAVDELIRISTRSRRARRDLSPQGGRPAELAQARRRRSRKIEAARAGGLRITADMYTYTAGATGLDAAMPPWVQAGGLEAWIKRLKDPAIARAADRGNAHAVERLGEPAAARRQPGPRAAGRLQEPEAEAAHRQDARRGREDARQESPRKPRSTW